MTLNEQQMRRFVSTVLEARPDLNEREPGGFAKINSEFLTDCWSKLMGIGAGVAYGEEIDGEPVGFLIGSHTEDAMTGVRTAFEYLFVMKHGHNGINLLKEFEEGAKLDDCKQCVVGCNTVYKHEAVGYWWSMVGYKLCSQSFQKWV